MRRVKRLIAAVRALAEQDGVVSDTAGISDDEFCQYLDDAQSRLQSVLEKINRQPFVRERIIDVVANQEAYDMPERTHLNHNVVTVEYSHTGNLKDYYPLRFTQLQSRDTSSTSSLPGIYMLRNKQLLINPIPSVSKTNGLRVNYVWQLPRLDKRRAKATSVTVSSGVVSAITLDTSDYTDYFPDASGFSKTNILVDDKFCLVDASGTIKAHNIAISDINESTGAVTLASTHVPDTGETSTSGTDLNNTYLVAGEHASSHSPLPTICERYLIAYCAWKIFKRDSSQDSVEQSQELLSMEDDLRAAWKDIVNDVKYPPVLETKWNYV